MEESLTIEKVLELIKETNRLSSERLEKELRETRKEFEEKLKKDTKEREKRKKELDERLEKEAKEREKRKKEFDERLEKEAKEREKRKKEFDEELKRSWKEFEKKIGEISGTLGRFVEGLVEPKLLELFQNRGINVTEIYHNIEVHKKGREETEIDLLLVNEDYSIAVEVKTTLKVQDVDDHLKRLEKLKKYPIRSIKGTTLIGAIAGMRVEERADKYAYRKGLFVLKQKGEIVEIANDDKFQPKEWVVG